MNGSVALGEAREIQLAQGAIRYCESGRASGLQSWTWVAHEGYMRLDGGKKTAVGVTTGR